MERQPAPVYKASDAKALCCSGLLPLVMVVVMSMFTLVCMLMTVTVMLMTVLVGMPIFAVPLRHGMSMLMCMSMSVLM